MIIHEVAHEFPSSCDECPLFVNGILGQQTFCIAKGKYTKEEIKAAREYIQKYEEDHRG